MRVFAGPNGSGKSTLKGVLPPILLGVYLNPDEIESEIRKTGRLVPSAFGVTTTSNEILGHLRSSPLLVAGNLRSEVERLHFSSGRLHFDRVEINSYFATAVLDFLRMKLLESKTSFTFETVMSHPSKIEILRHARSLGFRVYLYFIATEDPVINVSRVEARVELGGHPVPTEKIMHRYARSLDLLWAAIAHTNRAYIFDNSGDTFENTWVAEITDGTNMEVRSSALPHWFQRAVLDKVSDRPGPQ